MKKKLLALVMALTMVVPNGNGMFYEKSYASAAVYQKTETDYSEYTAISTEDQLANISENGKYYLANDIDLSEKGWTPIKTFSGVLDGRGYSISNMESIGTYEGGLFAEITGSATITNITLKEIYINNDASEPIGSIVGRISAKQDAKVEISNCSVQASLKGKIIGGIVGKISTQQDAKVEISNCSFQGDLEGEIVGGIVGACSPSDEAADVDQPSKIQSVMIKDCHSSGTFSEGSNSATMYLGGIAGDVENISIENCCSQAQFDISYCASELYAGGIASKIQNSTISACINMGELKVEGEHVSSGGICCKAINSTIQSVQSVATLASENSAGLVYNLLEKSTLNCGVSITRKGSVENYGITSYSDNTATISQCYYLKRDKNSTSDVGVGLTGEELRKQSNFSGFDFKNIWSMSSDVFFGYPVLQNYKSEYPENITNFAFEDSEITVKVGKSELVSAQVKTQNGFYGTITYSSEDPEIASVTENGAVAGLREGTTRIIAETDYGITTSCLVTVEGYNVAFEKDDITLTIGKKETLSLKIDPEDEFNEVVIYESENENVATVTKYGVVTAKKKGTTTIVAKTKYGGAVVATCTVTVSGYALEQIRLGYSSYRMLKGETFNLGETLVRLPEGSVFDNPVWESSEPKVATVDNEGKITALSAGTATITYKEGELAKACEITVKEIVVTADEKITLGLGNNTRLNYKATYSDGSWITYNEKIKLTFTSSNPKVVEVDNVGNLTAKSEGTANITVSVGDKKAVCKVTVPTVKIKLASKKTVQIGCTYATFSDATVNADINTVLSLVKWKSSNKKIASVNKYGVVTAKKAGKCTITATYKGKTVKCKITVPKVTVKLSKKKLTVRYNQSGSVYFSNKPSGANIYIKKIKNSKSKVAYASFENSYVSVRGLKPGKTTVTVWFNNGAKKKFQVVVPKLNLEEKMLSQKCYAKVGTIWKDTYGWRYGNVTIQNNSGKNITYVKFSVLEYDNKGSRLSSNKSASSYKYYINDTFYSSCTTRVDYGYDMRKVRVCVEKVYFSDGKTWKNPCYKQWYKKYKNKYE